MADAKRITKLLLKSYPDPQVELRFKTPLELLVATILSAQYADARVNEVTRSLFRHYRTARDYAEADPRQLEEELKSVSFHRNKARSIIGTARKITEDFKGRVPRSVEELVTLPGVGRKTANLVRGCAYHQQAIAVDTHVQRVSQRLGLTQAKQPERIEEDLMKQIPPQSWTPFTLALILHGRRICTARKPKCPVCPLLHVCEWPYKTEAPPDA